MRNLYVPLPEPAVDRLRELAAREMRGTKEQAAVLILDGLRRAGVGPEMPPQPERREATTTARDSGR